MIYVLTFVALGSDNYSRFVDNNHLLLSGNYNDIPNMVVVRDSTNEGASDNDGMY